MTRILAVTGGLDATGRTQLAINLGLELVRRGSFTGLFSDRVASAGLAELLFLPPLTAMPQRRADDAPASDVERRGYQGLDLLGCRVALDDWPICDGERLSRCVRELDTRAGYDDLLVDTSAMSASAALASCLVAHVVLVMVTPEPASHAQAFALLRILKLNGFAGIVYLVVNRVRCAVDGQDIQQLLDAHTRKYLGMALPLLGVLLEDAHVRSAQQYRQAFTTVFPEAEASGCIMVLTDRLEELVLPDGLLQQPLAAFWRNLRVQLERELRLPGTAEAESIRVNRAGPA